MFNSYLPTRSKIIEIFPLFVFEVELRNFAGNVFFLDECVFDLFTETPSNTERVNDWNCLFLKKKETEHLVSRCPAETVTEKNCARQIE